MIDLVYKSKKALVVGARRVSLIRSEQNKNVSSPIIWYLWLFVSVLVFLIQSYTIDILPSILQDEAQITDYGRLAFDPKSDWSATWLLGENKPLLMWSYLGPYIAEVAYQIFGNHGIGPRIAALIGGLLAGTMAMGWLLARKVPTYVAFILSLAFLLDPLFVLSQRMARVDSWVIACCLAACWILNSSVSSKEAKKRWSFAGIGALSAMALLVWPSAIFLFPLILFELIQHLHSIKFQTNPRKNITQLCLYLITGAVVTSFLLIIPVWHNTYLIFGDVKEMASLNIKSTIPLQDRLFSLINFDLWLKLIKAFTKTFSPLFPILALASLLYSQSKGLIFAAIFTLALIFATLVYEFRALYLLPYMLAMVGNVYLRLKLKPVSPVINKFSKVALGVLVLWSISISLVTRTYLGIKSKNEQQREKLYHAAFTSIGPGKHKVFLDYTYELYYTGRSLGWQLYTPYIQYTYDKKGNWIRINEYQPKEQFLSLLTQMDFAVFPQGTITNEVKDQLSQCGLGFQGIIVIDQTAEKENLKYKLNRNHDVLLWFLEGRKNYGPYLLYKKLRPTKS